MGQPVKIVELAERMIRLSGLEPGIHVEAAFTGMRPGEPNNLFDERGADRGNRRRRRHGGEPNEPPMRPSENGRGAGGGDREGRPFHHPGGAKDAVPEFASIAA